MVQYTFNAAQFQPQYGSAGGLPAGKHKVVIDSSEMKLTKDQQGGMLAFTLKCIEGQLSGLTMTDNLNLQNRNETAVRIANQQLSAYCAAVGVGGFNMTEELHNKPFFVEVGPQKNNPEYTEIKALYDIQGNKIGGGGSAGPPAGQQQYQPQPAAAPPAGFGPAGAAPAGFGGQPAQPAGGPPAGWGQPQPQPAPEPAAGAPGAPGAWGQPQPAPAAAPAQAGWPGQGGAAPAQAGWGPR